MDHDHFSQIEESLFDIMDEDDIMNKPSNLKVAIKQFLSSHPPKIVEGIEVHPPKIVGCIEKYQPSYETCTIIECILPDVCGGYCDHHANLYIDGRVGGHWSIFRTFCKKALDRDSNSLIGIVKIIEKLLPKHKNNFLRIIKLMITLAEKNGFITDNMNIQVILFHTQYVNIKDGNRLELLYALTVLMNIFKITDKHYAIFDSLSQNDKGALSDIFHKYGLKSYLTEEFGWQYKNSKTVKL